MLTINKLRHKIEKIDADIIEKLAARQAIAKKISQLKLEQGRDIIDLAREKALYEFYDELAEKYQLQQSFVKRLFKIIIANARSVQKL